MVTKCCNRLTLYQQVPLSAKGATTYRYDCVRNLTNITYATSPAITLQYDAVNRLTNKVDAAGTTRYTYDAAGQLLTEDGPWENDVVSNTYSNRLRLSFSSAGHTLADGNNTFTAIARSPAGDAATNTVSAYLPGTTTFAYDGNGNLTNDGRRAFFYDDENQLVRVVVTDGSGGSTRSDFIYDGKMRRRARIECAWAGGAWVTNRIVRYVYDGNLVLEERWFTPSVSASAVQQQVTYTRGRDLSGTMEGAGGIGGLLARTSYTMTSSQHASSYYHCDGNGNVTCLVNSNQLVVASYAYDPFGTVLRQSGPMAESNLYRFSSKELHENSGLVYYLYRFYDPSLQRWPDRDPIGERGGKNLYGFVANDPLDKYDPFGEDIGPKDQPPITSPPSFGKKPFRKGRDNCLCYALDCPGKPLQPDGGEGEKNATNCKDLLEQIKKNYPGTTDAPRGRFFGEGKCPAGTHKIAVFSDEGTPGYHVQRQDSDGGWSDMSKNPDKSPTKCNRGDSGKDCGNLCAPDQP